MTTHQRANPYVGPRAFQQGETLYGRDGEVQEVLNLLIAERIVLLYSPSGAGKSSLINAVLIPRLRGEDFRVRPPVRVNTEIPGELIAQGGQLNRFVLSALLSLEEGQPREQQRPIAELARLSLDDYLRPQPAVEAVSPGREVPRRSAPPNNTAAQAEVLIFDQFEEIITVDPANTTARVEFFKQLGEALRNRRRWAMLAMREDFIATLDPYTRYLPTRLHNTFRLDLLGPDAAQDAMQKPLEQLGGGFTAEAAHKLVDDLRRVRVQRPDGTFAEQLGPHIEPVQLQVVCYRLWDQLPAEATIIHAADVASVGNVDTVLADYYAASIATAVQATGVSERAIRDWFEEELITAQGVRGQVLRGGEQSQPITDQAIRLLIDAHIVRAEERRGARWFELAHDRLIEPIRQNNAAWREAHLSSLQRQADLWDQQNRSEGLLLRGSALSNAEQWAKDRAGELTETEQDFLAACRKARAAEQRERRNNRLIRGLAVAALVALVVAIGGVIIASQQTQIAGAQSRLAGRQKATAEAASQQAVQQKATAEAASLEANAQKSKAELALGEAQKQQQVSRSRELAAVALGQIDKDPERGLLIALEAEKGPDTFETQDAMRQLLLASAVRAVLRGHAARIESAQFSPNGQRIITASWDKTARVWDATTGQALAVLRGHEGPVISAQFSPDGQRIATASADRTARVWDAATGRELMALRGHLDRVNSVQFSPDGQQIVTASWDGTARVWNASTGKELVALRGNVGFVESAQFSPDGQQIVMTDCELTDTRVVPAACVAGTARVWDAVTGQELVVLRGHKGEVWSALFSPDGQQIVTASPDGTARVWDVATGKELITLRGHKQGVMSAQFSPDGQQIVTASPDGTARVWDVATGKELITLRGHESGVSNARFSPDGKWIVTAGWDGTARIWDAAAGKEVAALGGDKVRSKSAWFSSDGKHVVTTDGKTMQVWDAATGAEIAVLQGHAAFAQRAQLSPDGRQIVTAGCEKSDTLFGCADVTARVWDAATGKELAVLRGHEALIRSVQFSPDGKQIVTASEDQTARIWDAATGKELAVLRGHEGTVYHARFSPDGRQIVTVSFDNTARVWDAATGKELTVLRGDGGSVGSAQFSPDGQQIVTANDGTAGVWDAATGKKLAVLHGNDGSVHSAQFSPDGQQIATAGADGTAQVWDAATGKVLAVLRGHEGAVLSAQFSPDGKQIITASIDKTARVWDATTGKELAVLRGHEELVNSAQFSPDGRQIFTTSSDGTARVYVAKLDDLIALAKTRVTRELTCQEQARYLREELVCPTPTPQTP